MKLKESIKRFRVVNIIEDMKTLNSSNRDEKSILLSNLTFNSMFYIDIVAYYQPVTVSRISELIGVSKSAVTIKMAELEKKGYITKVLDKKDLRKKNIRLSEECEEILRSCDLKNNELYREITMKFSDFEIASFTEILNYLSGKRITEYDEK